MFEFPFLGPKRFPFPVKGAGRRPRSPLLPESLRWDQRKRA